MNFLKSTSLRSGLRDTQTGAAVVPNSAIARWRFEDASNTSNVVDSWNNVNGSITGAKYSTNAISDSQSLSFDGSDDLVSMGDVASLNPGTGEMSWSLWYSSNSSNQYSYFVEKEVFSSGYAIRKDTGSSIIVDIDDGSASVSLSTSNLPFDGTWAHIVVTWDGSTAKIYIDGTEEASDSNSSMGSVSNSGTFYLGHRDASDDHYQGKLDDVRVYDKALSNTEVSDIYNNVDTSGTSANTLYKSATLGTNSDSSATDMALDDTGNYVVVAGGFSVVDVTNRLNPTEVAYLNKSTVDNNYGIEAKGGYAFGAGFFGTLRVIDFNANQSPSNPQVVATLDYTSGEGLRKPKIDGNYLYLSSEQPGDEFYSVDITDPTNPTKADTVTQPSLDRDFEVEIVGSTALICARPSSVLVQIDVSDPTNMSVLGTYSDPNFVGPYAITADGSGTAFVSDGDGNNVIALDVTDPTNISTLGSVAPSNLNHPYGNDVYGPNNEYLVVACRGESSSASSDEYIVTLDVSDPSNMSTVGEVSVSDGYGPYDAVYSGNKYAYSVSRGQGVFNVIGDAK